jgi:hypothetical protein
MILKAQNKFQSLIDKIDSCTNPREGRAYLHTLRNNLKSGEYYDLDLNSLDEIIKIESKRGDSISRIINLQNKDLCLYNHNIKISVMKSEIEKMELQISNPNYCGYVVDNNPSPLDIVFKDNYLF